MVSGVRFRVSGNRGASFSYEKFIANRSLSKGGIALLSLFNQIAIVGWVEPTPGFVGFRCTQPNLHCSGVIMKCETQQRPTLNVECRLTNGGIASGLGLRSLSYDPTRRLRLRLDTSLSRFKIDRKHYSMFDVGGSMFDVHQFLFFDQTGHSRPSTGLTPET